MTTSSILDALVAEAQRFNLYNITSERPGLRRYPMSNWEFCDATPGCTLAKGHGGECKLAKGL